MRFKYIALITCSLILWSLSGCTENPIFGDSDLSNKLKVSGAVELEGQTDHSGIFVWLEEFNLSTYTDKQGRFSFTFPAPESLPGGAEAWNGIYKLYYYVNNYELNYSEILVYNGKVEFEEADIDANGNVTGTTVLPEMLKISTDAFIEEGQQYIVEITLQTPLNFASVLTIADPDHRLHGMFFRDVNSPETIYVKEISEARLKLEPVYGTLISQLTINPSFLPPPGTYEVIPYVVYLQDLPDGLLNAIGPGVTSYTLNYFNLPIRMETDTITIF